MSKSQVKTKSPAKAKAKNQKTESKVSDNKVENKTVLPSSQVVQIGLGSLSWWEFHGAKITPAQLRTVLANHSVDYEVAEINPESAVTQAIRDFRYSNGHRYKGELVSQNRKEIVINLLRRTKINDKKVEWHQAETLVWELGDMLTGTVSQWQSTGVSTEVEVIQARDKFIELVDEYQTYHDHRYLRPAILQRTFTEAKGISIRSRGGFYFVPQSNVNVLTTLDAICKDIGGVSLYEAEQMDSPKSREAIGNQVGLGLSDQLKNLSDKVEGWKKGTRNVRKNSASNTLSEFAELKAQIEMYADILTFKSDELLTELADMVDLAEEIIIDQGQKGRGVSSKSINRLKEVMIDKFLVVDGSWMIPLDAPELDEWPAGAKKEAYYTQASGQAGFKALSQLGAMGEIKQDALFITDLGV